ncbi:Uncharacterised protein [Klebsiella pneumoniae]|nr:Uncharacterised protein [Klebsiella pneumoniae]
MVKRLKALFAKAMSLFTLMFYRKSKLRRSELN